MSKVKGKQIQPIFIDNVECPELYADVKYFRIEHPTKINKALVHSSLEGPEIAVYARILINLEQKKSGKIFIKFPDFWEGLIDKTNASIQITPVGGFCSFYTDTIKDNHFIIFKDNNAKSLNVLIIAERIDVNILNVEPNYYYNKEEHFNS